MKRFSTSEIEKMILGDVMGLEINQFKELIQTGLKFEFSMVAFLEEEKGAEKFEIYATIPDQDPNKGTKKMVLTSQRKHHRRMTFHKAFEILREFGAKSFQVVLENEKDEIMP